MTYYVCKDCNLYHTGRKKPAKCDRCSSADFEKINVTDKEFNFVMQAVMSIKPKTKE